VNLFGWQQKENMSEENKETQPEKPTSTQGRASKKEVDLFPALLDRKNFPVVSSRIVPSNSGPQISMFTPANFDEALDIVECLRTRCAATICLENLKKSDANRLVDFVSGASAAIDGDFHKMSEQVYLFCPSNFRIISGQEEKTKSSKDTNPLDFLYNGGTTADRLSLNSIWSKP
jgi:cell division inhibitor SepF